MTGPAQHSLKLIPKVNRVLEWPDISPLLSRHSRSELVRAVRFCLESIRNGLLADASATVPDQEGITAAIAAELSRRGRRSLRTVINATGVVIHTNLGRAPLPKEAEAAIQAVAGGYSNLEYDLSSGERGLRNDHLEGLLAELTGAEAALVVNNNAAAVMLALSALAASREVVISRGELVEIGGSFRIPDVMAQSGARLVEVGTTNRTHPADYQAAISEATGLLLKVHTSNFAIAGFTASVPVAELAEIGSMNGIPVMLDAGSGCLVDLAPHGIDGETTIRQHLAQGAGVVTFSGDKLLGGPQAGIIVGRRHLIDPMKRHPLLRALRPGKLSLAALEATLLLYRDERLALRSIPALAMLTMTAADADRRAGLLIRRLRRSLPASVTLTRQRGESSAGGGSFPLLRLETALIEVRIAGHPPQRIEAVLRNCATPVIGRIHQDRFLMDVRTILDGDITALAGSLREAAAALTRNDQ